MTTDSENGEGMNPVAVRAARQNDARAVRETARETWHAAFDDFLGPETVEATIDDWYGVDGLRGSIAATDHVFLVATDESEIVGFAHAGPQQAEDGGQSGDDYALYRIYTLPAYWGEGVGTALLHRLEPDLRALGVEQYTLWVFADNDVGVSFYESHGFERVDERETTHKGVTVEEYRYRKQL